MTTKDFYSAYFKSGNISTDSRSIPRGSVFIALKGSNFNGNHFASEALRRGAVMAVVDEDTGENDKNIIKVDNTLSFLHELAHHHRMVQKFNILGLTGSNGKTTTKELIHLVLSAKYKVQSTQGNLNNHIGVPLTLLSLHTDTDYGIVEMGANHIGEINDLCETAAPDSGLITNIGKAHLEGFGSFNGVIKAKSELFEYIKKNKGTLFSNGSDKILSNIVGNYKQSVFYNSDNSTCNGRIVSSSPFLIVEITANKKDKITVNTNLFGDYNLTNILAAACVGLHQGISLTEIKRKIEEYMPSNMRSQVIRIGSSTVIMDCYNANPSSMELALNNVANNETERKIVILGSMKELGSFANKEHERIVDIAESCKFEKILLLGNEFAKVKRGASLYFDTFENLATYLHSIDLKNTLILIKGSRANQMERLETAIRNSQSAVS